MNSDLKIGIVVFGSVIVCLFFVAFTTPSFNDPTNKNIEIMEGSIPINLKVAEIKAKDYQADKNDETSLDYIDFNNDESNVNDQSDENNIIKETTTDKTLGLEIDQITNNDKNDNPINENKEVSGEISLPINDKKIVKPPKEIVIEPLNKELMEDIIYTIKEGDNLTKIALFYYLDGQKHIDISKANNGLQSINLKIGQKIKLPSLKNLNNKISKPKPLLKSNLVLSDHDIVYLVKKGDIASLIIQKYYGSYKYLKDVKLANPKVNLDRLKIGQKLTLPGLGK
ncbi:MAG: hypothetical protein COA79_16695 [Planctomycetota bacterium]|nr:MAG: hypothetical protein COA79_16695 [Planctomycetota bacterium]